MTRLRRKKPEAASARQARLRREKPDAALAKQARAIILLTRAPSSPGKTRLTSHLADDRARALRTALLLDTLDVARSLGNRVWVYYTPNDAFEEMSALVEDVVLAAQSGPDLGARMLHALMEVFAAGVDRALLIGSDLPTLPASRLTDAFGALEAGADCVFGPTEDGGYYVVGMSWNRGDSKHRARQLRNVFAGIEWGTDRVLEQSLSAANAAALTTTLIDPWFDVDSLDNLAQVVANLHAGGNRTRAWGNSALR